MGRADHALRVVEDAGSAPARHPVDGERRACAEHGLVRALQCRLASERRLAHLLPRLQRLFVGNAISGQSIVFQPRIERGC